jgi:hypothetical protein
MRDWILLAPCASLVAVKADECTRPGLDRLLDIELQRTLGRIEGPSPVVSRSAYHAAFLARRRGTPTICLLGLSGSRKTIIGIVAAVGLTTVSTALASSGSAKPQAWGRAVTAAVAACEGQLAEAHGVGECVSSITTHKGDGIKAPGSSMPSRGDRRADPPAGSRLEPVTHQPIQDSASPRSSQGGQAAGRHGKSGGRQPGGGQDNAGRDIGQAQAGSSGGGNGHAKGELKGRVDNPGRPGPPKPQ